MTASQPTKDEACAAAGADLARAVQSLMDLPPHESALLAYVPGGPPVEELERRICDLRGIPYMPVDRAA